MNYVVYTVINHKWECVGSFGTLNEASDWINVNHGTFNEVKRGSGKGYEIRYE